MRRILRRIAAPDIDRHVRDRAADDRTDARVDHADLDALAGEALDERVGHTQLAPVPRRVREVPDALRLVAVRRRETGGRARRGQPALRCRDRADVVLRLLPEPRDGCRLGSLRRGRDVPGGHEFREGGVGIHLEMDRHGSDGNAARLQVNLRDGLVVRDLRRVHPDAAQARRARHDHFGVVRAVVVRLRQRKAVDLAGLGRGQDAITDVEVALRVGERLGVLVRREGCELGEVLSVGRLPDAVFLRRIHRHHVHRSAHDRDVDWVGFPAIEGVALRGNVA